MAIVIPPATYGEIVSFNCPDYAVIGAGVIMSVTVRNLGKEEDFQVSIWDEYATPTPVEVARSRSIRIGFLKEATFYFDWAAENPPIMPDRNALFMVHALHFVWPWYWGWDGSATHLVKVAPTSAYIKVDGKSLGGYPLPDMRLEIYVGTPEVPQGYLFAYMDIPSAEKGKVYSLAKPLYVTGTRLTYGRMILKNALGSYEFKTPTKQFTLYG